MIRGSCACGTVRFELAERPSMLGVCHCARCRKAGSSAFVFVRPKDFRWVSGREAVAVFEPDPPFTFRRCFCCWCGTALGEVLTEADQIPVSAHALDDDPGLSVRFHEFTADKPSWCVIADGAPQFAGHPTKASA